jgi:hypothetical protein
MVETNTYLQEDVFIASCLLIGLEAALSYAEPWDSTKLNYTRKVLQTPWLATQNYGVDFLQRRSLIIKQIDEIIATYSKVSEAAGVQHVGVDIEAVLRHQLKDKIEELILSVKAGVHSLDLILKSLESKKAFDQAEQAKLAEIEKVRQTLNAIGRSKQPTGTVVPSAPEMAEHPTSEPTAQSHLQW